MESEAESKTSKGRQTRVEEGREKRAASQQRRPGPPLGRPAPEAVSPGGRGQAGAALPSGSWDRRGLGPNRADAQEAGTPLGNRSGSGNSARGREFLAQADLDFTGTFLAQAEPCGREQTGGSSRLLQLDPTGNAVSPTAGRRVSAGRPHSSMAQLPESPSKPQGTESGNQEASGFCRSTGFLQLTTGASC